MGLESGIFVEDGSIHFLELLNTDSNFYFSDDHKSFNEKAKFQTSRKNGARMDTKLCLQEKFQDRPLCIIFVMWHSIMLLLLCM